MLSDIYKIFNSIHGILLIVGGIAYFIFWFRTRLWLPKYVHFIALLSLILGYGMLNMVSHDAPIYKEWGGYAPIFIILLPVVIVYVVFIFFGGQHAAYNMKDKESITTCPFCGEKNEGSDSCANCGRSF